MHASYFQLTRRILIITAALALIATAPTHSRARRTPDQPSPPARATANSKLVDSYRNLPLGFEAHPDGARQKFTARGDGYALTLVGAEARMRLRSSELRLKLVNANPSPHAEGVDELPGKTNYLVGADPNKWRRNVASFARVRLREVYPGVDMIYYGVGRQIEYDFL
jgi:hypothetical protein